VRVLLFALLTSITTGLLFGLLPALRVISGSVVGVLRDDAASVLGARRRFGLTGLLVAGQVALSVLLLAVAGVFVESLVRAQSADPGFAWEPLALLYVSTQPLALDAEAAPLLHDRLGERLRSIPGVTGVTSASVLPAQARGTTTLLLGSGTGGVDRPSEIPWNVVAPGYFDILGIDVVAGRAFVQDDLEGPRVAIVSEAMARTYWGRSDVVGEHYRAQNAPDRPVEIVGVAADVPVRRLGEPPSPALYWPSAGAGYAYYLLETSGSPTEVLPAARAAVREIDARILVLDASTMRAHLGDTLTRQRLTGSLLAGIGGFALVLAMLGLYGVVSYAVSRRRSEVGIRMALGAARPAVVALFVRDVAGVVIAGGLLGLALAVPAVRLIGVSFTGGGTGSTAAPLAAALLLATALVATVLPARAAARVDPTRALRPE
jgi:putative ABC transport system permease protein